eukprot:TRINITY_DN6996_c0_g1_i1.p2 TRINITY_DN6996_c0_g1~~TRINITY_DN6996_c0_g1_i1.p2  ORF type:complete len:200 (+),score=11.02 TRINITY_DN6996_c0_g1_i1:67-666(+)
MCIRDRYQRRVHGEFNLQSQCINMSRRFTRLYIQNAKSRSGSREIGDLFKKIGTVSNIDISKGKGYVEYENPRDADKAIKELDDQKFGGSRLQVEYAVKNTNDMMRSKKERIEKYKKEGRCFKCGKRAGHIAKDCDQGKSRSRSRSRSSRSRSHSRGSSSNSRSPSRSKRHKKKKHRSSRKRYSRSRSRSYSRRRRSYS